MVTAAGDITHGTGSAVAGTLRRRLDEEFSEWSHHVGGMASHGADTACGYLGQRRLLVDTAGLGESPRFARPSALGTSGTISDGRPLRNARARCPWPVAALAAAWIMVGICRIGEASNPGPATSLGTQMPRAGDHGFDDPDVHDDLDFEGEQQFLSDQHWLEGHDFDQHWLDAGQYDAWYRWNEGPEDMQCLPMQSVDDGTPAFIAADSFGGRVEGMVFKTGPSGCGYYRDAPPAPPLAPTTIFLADLIDEPAHVAPTPSASRASGNRAGADGGSGSMASRPRTRPRKAAGTYTVQAEVAAGDRTHRDAGLYAFDSVNGNAWAGSLGYLETASADVAMIQETKKRRRDVDAAEREALRVGWRASAQAAITTEAGGVSGGVAVAARRWIGMSRTNGREADANLSYRLQLRWIGCAVRGGVHCGSVWLFPSEGLTQRNRRVLEEAALALRGVRGAWILGGDWNMSPDLLRDSGWLETVGGTICAPTTPTCNYSVNDYFIVANSVVHAVVGVSVVSDAGLQPHSPVRLYLAGGARRPLARNLLAPRKLEAVPPHGCATEAATLDARAATRCRGAACRGRIGELGTDVDHGDVSFTQWLLAAEADCAELHGLDHGGADRAYVGRANGPRFTWKPMAGPVATCHHYTSAASRRWRAIAKWIAYTRDLATARESGRPPAATVVNTARRAERNLTQFLGRGGQAEMTNHRTADGTHSEPVLAMQATAVAALLQTDNAIVLQQLVTYARDAAEREEAKMADARRAGWHEWIRGGAAAGLGRQHRFAKRLGGWVPSAVADAPAPTTSTFDTTHHPDLTVLQAEAQTDVEHADSLTNMLLQQPSGMAPLNRQQVVDHQASWWADFWGVGHDLPKPEWPRHTGSRALPRPSRQQMRAALRAFPAGTALAWDGLHPRLVARLSDTRIDELITLMMTAEATGTWPENIGFVSVVLLPRPDGGFRPIGLFPLLVRVWSKVRRPLVARWEADMEATRSYLYAGSGKGAHVAAWQHAFRAETAADAGATFAALLLDLEKCFEVVPHDLLVSEAEKLGYPLPLLRLSLASYRLPRVLAADGAFSAAVYAERGIAAGSALATTELRVLLIRLLDGVRRQYPQLKLSAYVDDIAIDTTSSFTHAAGIVAEAGRALCQGLRDLRLRLSKAGKCVVISTSTAVATDVADSLAEFGVRAVDRTKNLGAGMGAGVRRNASVQRKRWHALLLRLGRLATLLRSKISVSRLFRTGINASFTYGDDVVGVASSTLEARRRVVASAVTQTAAGRAVDATLIMADDHARQRLDPAFDAHAIPLVRWAEAAWCRWQSPAAMQAAITKAAAKLARAASGWRSRGPPPLPWRPPRASAGRSAAPRSSPTGESTSTRSSTRRALSSEKSRRLCTVGGGRGWLMGLASRTLAGPPLMTGSVLTITCLAMPVTWSMSVLVLFGSCCCQ